LLPPISFPEPGISICKRVIRRILRTASPGIRTGLKSGSDVVRIHSPFLIKSALWVDLRRFLCDSFEAPAFSSPTNFSDELLKGPPLPLVTTSATPHGGAPPREDGFSAKRIDQELFVDTVRANYHFQPPKVDKPRLTKESKLSLSASQG
jgi:hypothetical protein